MAASDLLRKMRSTGYPPSGDEPEEESGDRTLELTPEEMQSLGAQEGSDVVLEVSGKLTNGAVQVSSVMAKGPVAENQAPPQGQTPMVRLASELSPG